MVYISAALIIGFALGYLFKTNGNKSLTNYLPLSCTYAGTTYPHGAGFQSIDKCNSCSCMNGEVSCTLMACEGN